MYKKFSVFAAMLMAAGATKVCAQSSLTIFGGFDIGIRRVDNGGMGSNVSLASGGYRISRLGLRGVEDLGGGLHAGFKLESTLHPDMGKAGSLSMPEQFWNRGSYVELGSKAHGTLRLGYDLAATHRQWLENDPWFVGMGTASSLYDTTQNGPLREVFGPVARFETTVAYSRNMIQYLSPSIQGFSGTVAYAPGEGETTSTGAARRWLYALTYDAGRAFSMGVSSSHTQARYATTEPLRRLTDTVVTAAYDFDVVKLAASMRQFRAARSKERVAFLSVTVPVTPGRIHATYGKSWLGGVADTHLARGTKAGSLEGSGSTMLAVGYVHALSKRTSLYANAVRLSNRGGSFLGLPGGPPPNASRFSGGTSTGYDMGISHAF